MNTTTLMDIMAEKGEIIQQQLIDSISMPGETPVILQSRSDEQTTSTHQLTYDINKQIETGVEVKIEVSTSDYRRKDDVLDDVQRSNETNSNKCNDMDANIGNSEMIKLIQQLNNSITRLGVKVNVQLSKRDDETESIKQHINDINTKIKNETEQNNDLLTSRQDITDNEPKVALTANTTKSSICNFIKGFAESSTLHGLPRLTVKAKGWRIFWSILILSTFGMSILQLTNIFRDYFKYLVFVDVSLIGDYPTFPDITVCMNQPYKRSEVIPHPVSRNKTNFDRKTYWPVFKYIMNLPKEERIQLGYEASEMIYVEYSQDNQDYNIIPTLSHHRMLGNCYSFNPPNGTKRVSVFLNANFNEGLTELFEVGGFAILNQPGLNPFESMGQSILIDPYTLIYSTFQLDVFNRLNGVYGGCQDDEEKFQQRTGFSYTRNLCMKECRTKYAQMKCDCIILGHGLPSGFKIPELWNIRNCSDYEEKSCFFEKYNLSPKCLCKPMCRTSVYGIRTRVKEMLDSPAWFKIICRNYFTAACNNNSDYVKWARRNFAKLDLVSSVNQFKEFTQKPLYPLPLSDLGGTLGFYLGASVLTFFELIQMLSGLILFLFKRRTIE